MWLGMVWRMFCASPVVDWFEAGFSYISPGLAGNHSGGERHENGVSGYISIRFKTPSHLGTFRSRCGRSTILELETSTSEHAETLRSLRYRYCLFSDLWILWSRIHPLDLIIVSNLYPLHFFAVLTKVDDFSGMTDASLHSFHLPDRVISPKLFSWFFFTRTGFRAHDSRIRSPLGRKKNSLFA